MEKRNEKIRKALKKIDIINNYLMGVGAFYLLVRFFSSSYEKSLDGFFTLIWDTISSRDFWYLFIGDTCVRFIIFYLIIKETMCAFLSSIPFGIGWTYTKRLLAQKPSTE